jgi:prepilin-type N-terminal cleavage/methylation domain-containing protein
MYKNNYKKISFKTGVTLVEILISVAILSMLTLIASTFQKDVFSLNFSLQGSLNAQIDARHVVKVIVTELREVGPSAVGAYSIELASSTGVTFYSDVNNDGLKDKVRYFLSGTEIKRGVTSPSGSPLTYNSANEKLSTIVSSFVASSTRPLFQYYPSTYTGNTPPMSYPIDIQSIRFVKVTVIIDKDPNRSPSAMIVSSQVNLRNLKDNL